MSPAIITGPEPVPLRRALADKVTAMTDNDDPYVTFTRDGGGDDQPTQEC